jgi:HSP20 family protein
MATKTLTRLGHTGLALSNGFNEFLRPWSDWFNEPAWERALSMPAVNISETDKSYNLSVAAPGLKKEDFNVAVDGNILTISSEKEKSTEDKGEDYSRREYNYSSFSRSFTLPEEVKQDAIEAEYKNGELLLTLPKREAEKKATTKVAIK